VILSASPVDKTTPLVRPTELFVQVKIPEALAGQLSVSFETAIPGPTILFANWVAL
jgi:hypothetical protein